MIQQETSTIFIVMIRAKSLKSIRQFEKMQRIYDSSPPLDFDKITRHNHHSQYMQ